MHVAHAMLVGELGIRCLALRGHGWDDGRIMGCLAARGAGGQDHGGGQTRSGRFHRQGSWNRRLIGCARLLTTVATAVPRLDRESSDGSMKTYAHLARWLWRMGFRSETGWAQIARARIARTYQKARRDPGSWGAADRCGSLSELPTGSGKDLPRLVHGGSLLLTVRLRPGQVLPSYSCKPYPP